MRLDSGVPAETLQKCYQSTEYAQYAEYAEYAEYVKTTKYA